MSTTGVTMTNATQAVDQEKLLLDEEAATFLAVSTRTLARWRVVGFGPKFIRISSRAVRYRKRDLIAWAEANLHGGDVA
jgi:predicted DNA-binding transcriptional regulator AlpA